MISYMINVIQQENVSQITKSFVALSIVVKIDDMFSASLPKEILDNAIKLNEQALIKLSLDHNTTRQIFSRIKCKTLPRETFNILFNFWYGLIINFQ